VQARRLGPERLQTRRRRWRLLPTLLRREACFYLTLPPTFVCDVSGENKRKELAPLGIYLSRTDPPPSSSFVHTRMFSFDLP
jgi:hypothetical protein